jgi:hypothetical protein
MGTADLRVLEGNPGVHSNDLAALTNWLAAEHGEDDDGLLALISATETIALHPLDEDRLAAVVVQVQNVTDEDTKDLAWTNVAAFAAGLLDRYGHSYSDELGRLLRGARKDLSASRGPPIYGRNGAFRRGDLVARPFAREGKIVGAHDAVFLEAEPLSEHVKTYGRMAAVHNLTHDVIDRWYVDQLFLGIDFGRPF